jgi:NAD+ kinase
MRPQKVGLIAHTGKPGAAELVRAICAEFDRHALPVLVESRTAALVQQPNGRSVPELARETDLLVALGGDGTILGVVGELGTTMKPIFGINIGSLGFLTCAASSAYQEAVNCIAGGHLQFSARKLLEVTIGRGTAHQQVLTALNDAVFSRGEVSRLIRLQVRVNSEPLTEFNADGLIVATPTGSTAYSLSAGGPILSPESGALVITPICPHVLTNRSIILGEDAEIEVEATEREYPVYLTVDGREPVHIPSGATVEIKRSPHVLPLAAMPGVSFFSVVRQKLKWSGSNV